jgi:hypothetical protein
MHTMTRTQRMLLAVCSIFLMGACASQCDRRSPTITCSTANVTVAPGTCTAITNPCADNRWLAPPRIDGFQLCSPSDGISVRTRGGVGLPTTREICAEADVAIVANRPVEYRYTRGFGFGKGTINITTGNPMTAVATATPATIDRGQSTQLLVTPSGGVPPYTYGWVPVSSLNASNIQNPIASPTITTIYDVTVTDAAGLNATVSVVVNVRRTLEVAAFPPVINPGQSSQLNATATGGSPPYSFAWVPASSLVGADTSSPIATPSTTTTYVVTVTDSAGASMGGSVTVTVTANVLVTAFATPDTIRAGGTSLLQAFASGGTLPYSYSWNPAGSLDNPASSVTTASPSATTTYTVVVTDGAGGTANASITVTVIGGGPTACFTYTNDTVSQFINLNASCSTGGVVRYDWDFSFEPGNIDLQRTSPIAQWEYGFGDSGTITLTVFDALGPSSSTSLPFP